MQGKSSILLAVCLLMASCRMAARSGGELNPETAPAQDEVSAEASDFVPPSAERGPPPQPKTAIEIIWEIPADSVDSYIIRYGLTSSNLDREVKVKAAELSKISDSRYGDVFHYLITDAPTDKVVFVKISAVNGETESEPSKVFEVAPSEKGAQRITVQ